MKQLLGIVVLCFLCSCENRLTGGSGGVSANIDVRTTDESEVILRLEEWMMDHGFEKRSQSWQEFTGDGEVRNNNGEVVDPVTYVKPFSNGQGHLAWGVAPATEECQYVTVFHDAEFLADGEAAFDELEKEFEQENRAFHSWIE